LSNSKGEPLYPWPAAIHDAKSAVRFLKSRCDEYSIDTSNIGAIGASSGAHLALLLGLTKNEDFPLNSLLSKSVGNTSSMIQAVVNISGPTEMVSGWESKIARPFFEYFLSGSPIDNPQTYKESSPIEYIDQTETPILTIHGVLDDVVPFPQALILDSVCKISHHPHTLLTLENQGHIFQGPDAKIAWDSLYSFFDVHLKNKD
jgi:acetyl esterase/lipase